MHLSVVSVNGLYPSLDMVFALLFHLVSNSFICLKCCWDYHDSDLKTLYKFVEILIGQCVGMRLADASPSKLDCLEENRLDVSSSHHAIRIDSIKSSALELREPSCSHVQSLDDLTGHLDNQAENNELLDIVCHDGLMGNGVEESHTQMSYLSSLYRYLNLFQKPATTKKKQATCSLCLENITWKQDSDPHIHLWETCQHPFCKECIKPWLEQEGEDATCPNCRLKISPVIYNPQCIMTMMGVYVLAFITLGLTFHCTFA
ncbi:hypothetical protein PSHT_00279 [Puccinia striiformis]|uniref:RING-type domain-containing protein n=1 Tax=Puccinia striiformis TaxID=27350 RepID=A0A2S4WNB0_9BASI|nr:hypothetical protein PSHT_00279 [Puccinia striiformis]